MRISGRLIAKEMYQELHEEVTKLKQRGITPHLAVLLVGNNPSSHSYVRQKKTRSEQIGSLLSVYHFPETTTTETLLQTIQTLNADHDVHGIIVQRPLPAQIDKDLLAESTSPEKDIDGFHSHSQYGIPVALAVFHILERIYAKKHPGENDFSNWLNAQRIVCLGKGDTAGKPIIDHLQKLGFHPVVVDSQTPNPQEVTRHADIIISSVGKPGIINETNIKHGAILIGVGITKNGDESLLGDYDVEAIKDIAGYYTPTPGGVGPVNVAFLLNNLTLAAKKKNE